jgi:outer membrane protein assembly factor BamB
MYELSKDGANIKRVWNDSTLDVHHGGVVLIDGFIYGSNWENNRNGNWVCLDWKTGKVMYETKWINKGSIIAAEGMLYCYEEKEGNLALLKASPKGFDIISSFKIEKGSGQHWAHPVISDGRLYLRHGEALMVYDIKSR